MVALFSNYAKLVQSGQYPAPEHCYEMPADEKAKFLKAKVSGF
jgi:hypothetical protein